MATREIMAEVADRLVGGMMLHSDHADLMCFLGFKGLKRYHEKGYHDDAMAFRKVHRKAIEWTGILVPNGDQRSPEDLTPFMNYDRMTLDDEAKRNALEGAMQSWHDWEQETVKVYSRAARDLMGMGEAEMWKKVFKLQRKAERELNSVRKLICEMKSCNWDMCHIIDMQGPMHERYHNPCGRQ